MRAALRWVRDFDWTARAAFFDPDYLFKRDMRRIARSCVLRPTVDQGNYLLVLWSAHVPATEPF